MNWIYSIGFDLTGAGKISQAESSVRKLDNAVEQTGASAVQTGGQMERMGQRGQNGFNRMINAARNYLGIAALVMTTMSSLNVAAQFDAQNIAIDFATSGNGAQSIEFVRQKSDELGISLAASREGYKQLAASTMNTPLSGKATDDIFEGVATAGAAMRLSEEQIKGAFLAIGQIQSKGKVQAEELRGQLGERLPGAFRIAAKAMGVTQQELNKLLETGQVISEDFLPKFAAQLMTEFGPAAAAVADGPAASMERFKTSVYNLQVAVGTYLLPTMSMLITDYFIPSAAFIGENIDMLMGLAKAVASVYAITKVYAISLGIATLMTGGFTGANVLLNAVLNLNPYAAVITALVALSAGLYYAWNSSETFRAVIKGTFAGLKEMGGWLYDGLISPIIALGKVMVGAFTFNPALIAEGLEQGTDAMVSLANRKGSDIAEAYNKGYNQEMLATKDVANAANMGNRGSLFARTNELAKGNAPDADGTPPAAAGRNGLSGITGRSATRNVTINLENLVGELKIVAATLQGGADEAADLLIRKLTQVINSANGAQ